MRKIIGKKNKVHYVEETTRFQMVKSHKGWLVVGASMLALGLGLTMPATTTHASQLDGQWTARTVQEIKADFDKSGTSKSYTIQWGDTLSAISAAINVSQDRLAQINSIENKDLIFAGNTIKIDGSGSDATITIKGQDGKADKVYNVDPNKPVVNNEKTKELQSKTESQSTSTTSTENATDGTASSNTGSITDGTTSGSNAAPVSNGNTSGGETKPGNTGNTGSDDSNNTPSVNKTELEKLKETLASQNAKLSDLESKLTAAQSDLDTAKAALDAAQNKDISQFESAVQAQTEKVNAIKADIDTAKSSIDTNTKTVQSLNGVIETLKANIASADTDAVNAQNGLVSAQSNSDAKTQAYNQIVATISAQYPNVNVNTDEGLALLAESDANLKESFDAAKSAKDDSDLELENAKTAVSNANEAKQNMQASLTENENKVATLNEQINADTAKVSTLQSQLTTETATLSELQQKLDDAKNSNVDELQADVKAKQTVVDNLTKEIESVKSQIAETTKAIADIELKVAREDATKSINSLKYLVASEKADFTNQLNATLTQDAINTIVTAAQAKDAANKAELDLKTSKTNAVSEINNLKFLSDKQSFTDKVNAADSINAVASILAEAKTQDAAEQLAKSKVDAISKVNALSGLNDSEKASFTDKINAATNLDGVSSIVSEAKTLAQLNTYKESAKTTISNLTKLSDESKTGYTTRIDSSTSAKEVDAIVAQAKAENQLIQDKESAVSKIKALVNLSDKEQASFVEAVTNATSKSAVDTVVSTAKAQDQKNLEAKQLEELRVNVKSEISAMGYLSDAQKQGFTSKVDAANTKTAVSNLLVDARATNELEKAKSEATTKINNLEHLSTKAKSDFTAKVANATTKDAVASVVSDANIADALVKTKDEAKSTIDEFKFLSNNVKSELKAKVDAANTTTAVSNLLDEARATNELEKAKSEATTEINNLKYLPTNAKSEFTAKVATATTKDTVASIVSDAKVADALVETKEDAKSTIDGFKFLSDKVKSELKTKVEAAKTETDVKSVVDYATQANEDAKQLQDVQAESIDAINAMTHLTQEQKDAFISKINESNLISEVKSTLADAVTENKLAEAKANAVSAIDALTHLSDSEKTSFKDKVAAAKAEDAISPIVSDAKTRDALVGSQNDAIANIMALTYISADQKADFVAQIKATNTASAIKPISDAATKAESDAKELREAKDAALETAKGYTHVSDDIKTKATTAIEAATSKDDVAKLIANLKVEEDKAIAKELADAKVKAETTINAMQFLQADQKADFVKQANSAKDMTALNTVINAAVAQDKIESQKGTVTFQVVGLDGQVVTTVTQRIMEGNYAVTLKDLGLTGSNIVFQSGDLTGTIKAQERKTVKINIVDTTKVQTLILHARDVDTSQIIKTMTVYYVAGQMFAPSYDQFKFDPKEWRTAIDVSYSNRPATAGAIAEYTFDFEAVRPVLDAQQTTIAQQELVRLINNYRASYGLSALASDPRLDEASSIRAKETEQKFSHVRPNGNDFNSVLTQVGYTDFYTSGENIAYFSGTNSIAGSEAAQRLFDQWKNSPSHNANMLDASYTHVSFGVYATENGVYSSTVFTG